MYLNSFLLKMLMLLVFTFIILYCLYLSLYISLISVFLILIQGYFFMASRGRRWEREKEREGNIDRLPSCTLPTGDCFCNLGSCPDWESNPDLSVNGTVLQPTEPHWPELLFISFLNIVESLKYEWHTINSIYLKCVIWCFCLCETITTMERINMSSSPKGFSHPPF